jgi:hypothetical protein
MPTTTAKQIVQPNARSTIFIGHSRAIRADDVSCDSTKDEDEFADWSIAGCHHMAPKFIAPSPMPPTASRNPGRLELPGLASCGQIPALFPIKQRVPSQQGQRPCT